MDGEFLVPRAEPVVVLEPPHAPLDHVPTPVDRPAEDPPPLALDLVRPLRDHIPDAASLAPLAHTRVAVALVAEHPRRPAAPRADGRHHVLEALGLVRLTRRHRRRQRHAVAAGHEVDLGSPPAT